MIAALQTPTGVLFCYTVAALVLGFVLGYRSRDGERRR